MSPKITSTPATPGDFASLEGAASDHFDGLESGFFEQGQDGALRQTDDDYFEDDETRTRRRWFAPSRQFFTGLAMGGLFGAALCGIFMFRVSGKFRASSVESESRQQAAVSQPSTVLTESPPAAPARPAEPAGRVGENAAPAAASAEMLVAVPDAGVCDTGHPVEPTALAVAPTADTDKPSGALAVPPGGNDAQQACRKAVAEKQKKAILAKCTEAFAADPRAADIAVLLAKLEFDRGRLEQAFDWSKKAIAVDPTLADAYVFIGEAEQSAGHAKAAKDAYARYLHLAPSGRYAADLRAVLRSL